MKNPSRRKWYAPLLIALGAALLLISFAAIALLVWLRPAAQDWQQSLRLGPITLDVGVEKLIRLGSRREVAALLDGRSLRTPTGVWRISTAQEASELICERCQLTLPALGRSKGPWLAVTKARQIIP